MARLVPRLWRSRSIPCQISSFMTWRRLAVMPAEHNFRPRRTHPIEVGAGPAIVEGQWPESPATVCATRVVLEVVDGLRTGDEECIALRVSAATADDGVEELLRLLRAIGDARTHARAGAGHPGGAARGRGDAADDTGLFAERRLQTLQCPTRAAVMSPAPASKTRRSTSSAVRVSSTISAPTSRQPGPEARGYAPRPGARARVVPRYAPALLSGLRG